LAGIRSRVERRAKRGIGRRIAADSERGRVEARSLDGDERRRIPLSPPNFALQNLARSRHKAKILGEEMYCVYILLNEAKTRTYTGVADDVNKRLDEHNAGKVKSSRPYRPYKVIHVEPFGTLSEARRQEAFYKSTVGRRRLKEMLFD
jgi:putative endonuclease